MNAKTGYGTILLFAKILLAICTTASGVEPHPAICRVRVAQGSEASLGSGTLIAADESRGLILTAYHVIDGGGKITCTFPDGKAYYANVTAYDRDADLAALTIAKPHVAPVSVTEDSSEYPYWTSGYGGDGSFKAMQGDNIGASNSPGQVNMIIRGLVRPGDSGAALLDRRGRLVGVIWGCRFQDHEVYVTTAGPFRRFMGRLLNLGIPVYPVGESESQNTQPQTPSQPTPAVPKTEYRVYLTQYGNCYGGNCYNGNCQPSYTIPSQPQYAAPVRPQPTAPWEGKPWGPPITGPSGQQPSLERPEAPQPPQEPQESTPQCKPCDCGPKWEAAEQRLTQVEKDAQGWVSVGGRIDKLESQLASVESRMVPVAVVEDLGARIAVLESRPQIDVEQIRTEVVNSLPPVDGKFHIRVRNQTTGDVSEYAEVTPGAYVTIDLGSVGK